MEGLGVKMLDMELLDMLEGWKDYDGGRYVMLAAFRWQNCGRGEEG